MTDTLIEPRLSDPDHHDDNEVAHIVKRNDANAGYIVFGYLPPEFIWGILDFCC